MKIEALLLAASMAIFASGCIESADPVQGPVDDTLAHGVVRDSVSDELRADSRVSSAGCAPRRSTYVRIDGNLDANASPGPEPFEPKNPAVTSNFSTTIFVYDGIGRRYVVGVYFEKIQADSWQVHAIMDAGSNVTEVGSFPIRFDPDGALHGTALPFIHMPPGLGFAPSIELELGFGDDVVGHQPGRLTQVPAPHSITSIETDGRGFLAIDACSP